MKECDKCGFKTYSLEGMALHENLFHKKRLESLDRFQEKK